MTAFMIICVLLIFAVIIACIYRMATDDHVTPVDSLYRPIRESADMDLEDEFVWPPHGSRYDPP